MKEELLIKNDKYNYETYLIKKYNFPCENNKVNKLVLACHGFGSNKESTTIQRIAEEFGKINVPVISFDWSGHGENKKILTVNNCIQDLKTILEYIDKEFPNFRIILFGSSFGGYMIINYLINMPIKTYNLEKYIFLKSPAIKMNKIFKEVLLEEDIKKFEKRGYTIKTHKKYMKIPYVFYEELEQYNINKKLKEIPKKIIIFHGNKDKVSLLKDIKENISDNTKLIELNGAEHSFKGEFLEEMIKKMITKVKNDL